MEIEKSAKTNKTKVQDMRDFQLDNGDSLPDAKAREFGDFVQGLILESNKVLDTVAKSRKHLDEEMKGLATRAKNNALHMKEQAKVSAWNGNCQDKTLPMTPHVLPT